MPRAARSILLSRLCRVCLCFFVSGQAWHTPQGIDPRLRWAADIYNQSLTQAAKSADGAYAIPMGGTFRLPFGELTVTFNEADLIWAGVSAEGFYSCRRR